MIVPTDHPNIESVTPREYPPDDARAMSPRRTNEKLTGMCEGAREKIQRYFSPLPYPTTLSLATPSLPRPPLPLPFAKTRIPLTQPLP